MAFDPDELDEGIRDLVLLLREHGFPTTDSGDGTKRTPDAMTMKHVVCSYEVGDAVHGTLLHHAAVEGMRLKELVRERLSGGPETWQVDVGWTVGSRCVTVMLYDVSDAIAEFCSPQPPS